jgi:hypothetical protein
MRSRLQSGASGRPLNFTVRSHWVKTAALFGAAVVVLLLDALASVRVGSSEVLTRAQKTAWLLLVWLAPLVGAILAMQVSRETSVPAPARGPPEGGSGLGDPGISPHVGGFDGGGHGGGDASVH